MMQGLIRSFFFMILFFFSLSAQAQKEPVIIFKAFNNTPLDKALEWIEEEHKVYIAYSKNLMEGIIINQIFENEPLEAVIKSLIQQTSLEYKFLDSRKVIIGPNLFPKELSTKTTDIYFEVKGIIKDPNGNPLSYASIFNPTNEKGTYSDKNGVFSLYIKKEENASEIIVSYLGYKEDTILLNNNDQEVTIQLNPQVQRLSTITVTDFLPPPPLSENLSPTTEPQLKDFKSLPSLLGRNDLFRRLQLNAGIKAYDDFSSRLQVRGSNADENMIVLDGMTLYNVDHLYGIFSAVHPGIFESITIHKNAFPIEFGGRTASVVELQSNNPNNTNLSNSIGLDLNVGQALLKIPINKKIGLITAGRFTHSDVSNASLFKLLSPKSAQIRSEDENRNAVLRVLPNFQFYDLYAKLQWDINEKQNFSINWFKGYDRHKFSYEESFEGIINNRLANITEEGNENINWQNNAIGFNFNHKWSDNLQTTFNFSHSSYSSNSQENYTVTTRYRILERERILPSSEKDNRVEGNRLDIKTQWQPSNKQKLIGGYTFTSDKIGFKLLNTRANDERLFDWSDEAARHSFYGEFHQIIGKSVQLSAGLNNSFYNKTNTFHLSPRIQANIQVNPKLSLKSSWSLYYQFLRQLYHEDIFGNNQTIWVLANGFEFLQGVTIPLANSKHFMAGGEFKLNSWSFDLEFYQINRVGVLEYALLRPGFNRTINSNPNNSNFGFFEGIGQTTGIDFLIKKSSKKYRAWLAYTLSKSTLTLSGVNLGEPYPSPEDSRHQLKFVNEYQIDQHWSVSFNYIFASGLPYLDYSQVNQIPSSRRLLFYDNFLQRYADYHRFDLGLNYYTKVWNNDLNLSLSIFNLFNRSNVKYRQFVFTVQREDINEVLGTELTLLPRILNVGAELSF